MERAAQSRSFLVLRRFRDLFRLLMADKIMDDKPATKLEKSLAPLIEAEGFTLVDIDVSRAGRRQFVRVYVYARDGVSLGDCHRISRRLEPIIDAMGTMDDNYVLEVSSPGLTKVLNRRRDFTLFKGRLVRVMTLSRINGGRDWVGELMGTFGSVVRLRILEKGEVIDIPMEQVRTARLVYESPEDWKERQRREEEHPQALAHEDTGFSTLDVARCFEGAKPGNGHAGIGSREGA